MFSDNTRVCKEWFPKGSYKGQREDGFPMATLLMESIDVLVKNVVDDWDFTIIVSGMGEVRVGKSILAMQVAIYWCYQMEKVHGIKVPFTIKNNIVLQGKKLIEKGNYLGKNHPYSPLQFDEAGADLEGRKVMRTITQDVLDYYRECGQYNMLNLIVLPEFFDLPKGIAVTRSICLLDVYYSIGDDGKFTRGYFRFFSRPAKKELYMKGKKDLDYGAAQCDFSGNFQGFCPVNEKEYKGLKREALVKRESQRRSKFQIQRDACWYLLTQEFGLTQQVLGKRMEQLTGIFVAPMTISDGIRHFMSEDELLATSKS